MKKDYSKLSQSELIERIKVLEQYETTKAGRIICYILLGISLIFSIMSIFGSLVV